MPENLQWYDSRLAEILVVPGFVSARRYRLEIIKAGWPAWFDPTPWTSLDANAIGARVPAPAR